MYKSEYLHVEDSRRRFPLCTHTHTHSDSKRETARAASSPPKTFPYRKTTLAHTTREKERHQYGAIFPKAKFPFGCSRAGIIFVRMEARKIKGFANSAELCGESPHRTVMVWQRWRWCSTREASAAQSARSHPRARVSRDFRIRIFASRAREEKPAAG